MNNKFVAAVVLNGLGSAAIFAASEAWAADGNSFSLATGFDYSTGKYGLADTTNILSIPVVGMYSTGPWAFKLTVPYVRISGVGGVLPDGRRIRSPMAAMNTRSTTQSGLGDIVAAATFNLYSVSESNLGVDLTGKVKFGTASTSLGTGQNDYGAQVDVYQRWDRFTPMVVLGYEVLGSPAGVDMNNVAYGTLGGYYQITDQAGGGAEMMVSQRPSVIGAEQRELTAYVSHRIDGSHIISGYVLKGFSDGSPDSGFGVKVSSDL